MPVTQASVITSPLLKPCAAAVMIVGLPTATPVIVTAEPVPVPIARTEPCAEIAEEAIRALSMDEKKAAEERLWLIAHAGGVIG